MYLHTCILYTGACYKGERLRLVITMVEGPSTNVTQDRRSKHVGDQQCVTKTFYMREFVGFIK